MNPLNENMPTSINNRTLLLAKTSKNMTGSGRRMMVRFAFHWQCAAGSTSIAQFMKGYLIPTCWNELNMRSNSASVALL